MTAIVKYFNYGILVTELVLYEGYKKKPILLYNIVHVFGLQDNLFKNVNISMCHNASYCLRFVH